MLMTLTLMKIVMVLAIMFFFTVLGTDTYLDLSYSANMPQAPDPASGRTHLISVNHNHLVYVTDAEYASKKRADEFFFIGGGLSIALIAFLKLYYKVF
jgi:hypothetical protein